LKANDTFGVFGQGEAFGREATTLLHDTPFVDSLMVGKVWEKCVLRLQKIGMCS
jgi:hypothetical protein